MITTTLPKAWKAFKNWHTLGAIVCDAFFFFAIITVLSQFVIPGAALGEQLSTIIAEEANKLGESNILQLESTLMANEDFVSAYRLLQLYLFVFIPGILLVLLLIFKTPIWWLTHSSILKKMPFATTALKAPLLTLFWFAIFAASYFIYSISTGSSFIIPLGSTILSNILFGALLLLISYFMPISFALIPAQQTFKKTFSNGIHYAKKLIPAYLVNTLLTFIAVSTPLLLLFNAKPLFGIIAIIIISLPVIHFTRLHITLATWQK